MNEAMKNNNNDGKKEMRAKTFMAAVVAMLLVGHPVRDNPRPTSAMFLHEQSASLLFFKNGVL